MSPPPPPPADPHSGAQQPAAHKLELTGSVQTQRRGGKFSRPVAVAPPAKNRYGSARKRKGASEQSQRQRSGVAGLLPSQGWNLGGCPLCHGALQHQRSRQQPNNPHRFWSHKQKLVSTLDIAAGALAPHPLRARAERQAGGKGRGRHIGWRARALQRGRRQAPGTGKAVDLLTARERALGRGWEADQAKVTTRGKAKERGRGRARAWAKGSAAESPSLLQRSGACRWWFCPPGWAWGCRCSEWRP